MKKLTPFIIAVALFSSCKKEDDEPLSPVIEFVSISTDSVAAFSNSVEIVFSYEDLQGDLGEEDADDYSLRVKDDRLGDYDYYHVPPMTPDLMPLHIKGEYKVILDPLFLMGNGASETTKFTLQIRDRNGNWSNSVVTPNVVISP